ncbi:MAG: helix-turn-helix transcriptional regulator [Parcubacteria group bacterium]|nr:helix-turn-helix transcriptional regulator [Parcubacteria group bacterium]
MQNNWVRKSRIEKKISQFKMAKALCISSQQLSAWELNKEIPNQTELKKIKNFFDKPELFFKKNRISLKRKTFNRGSNNKVEKKDLSNEVLKKFYFTKKIHR